VVSGGIRLDNIGKFMDAGADAVTIGGSIINEYLRYEDWPGLLNSFKQAVEAVRSQR
jgi:2-keto-3-deoxy-6-phosphogluconate aldolase